MNRAVSLLIARFVLQGRAMPLSENNSVLKRNTYFLNAFTRRSNVLLVSSSWCFK